MKLRNVLDNAYIQDLSSSFFMRRGCEFREWVYIHSAHRRVEQYVFVLAMLSAWGQELEPPSPPTFCQC